MGPGHTESTVPTAERAIDGPGSPVTVRGEIGDRMGGCVACMEVRDLGGVELTRASRASEVLWGILCGLGIGAAGGKLN